jgi:hypothetical protein
MAADFGVTRQTLNYRLSRKAAAWLENAYNTTADDVPARSRNWRRHMTELRDMVQELLGDPEEGANLAAARDRMKARLLRAITSRPKRRRR